MLSLTGEKEGNEKTFMLWVEEVKIRLQGYFIFELREKQQGDSGNAVGTCDYFSTWECVTSLNIIHSKSLNLQFHKI